MIKPLSGLFIVVSVKAFQFSVRIDSRVGTMSVTHCGSADRATHQAGITWPSPVRCPSCTNPNLKSSFNF